MATIWPTWSVAPYCARAPRHLHGDDEAAEEADQNDDGQAAHADDVHLDGDVIHIVRAAEEIADRAPGKNIEILDSGHRRLQEVEQTGPRISRCYHGAANSENPKAVRFSAMDDS